MIDKDLKRTVERALEWEPSIDAGDMAGVSVEGGVVTLRGNCEATPRRWRRSVSRWLSTA